MGVWVSGCVGVGGRLGVSNVDKLCSGVATDMPRSQYVLVAHRCAVGSRCTRFVRSAQNECNHWTSTGVHRTYRGCADT